MENLRVLGAALLIVALSLVPAMDAMGANTADVTVNATPIYLSITVAPTGYGFGAVAVSSWTNTTTTYFTITNACSVVTNQTISVTSATWTGGVSWTHSDTGSAGSDIVGMIANKGGTWGSGDVIVKNASPVNIATNQAATTNYSFGLNLKAPTVFSDGVLKNNTVRVTATQV